VREGDVVKLGDLLVELDCIDQQAALIEANAQLGEAQSNFNAAKSNVNSASQNAMGASENVSVAKSGVDALKTQAELARIELERDQELVNRGALTQSALDESRSKHDSLLSQIAQQSAVESMNKNQAGALWASGSGAKAQASAASSNITVAKAAVVRAELSVTECKLYAPRNAMVVTRNLEPGEPVVAGSNVLAMTDVTDARMRFYIPNSELAAAAPGRKTHVIADAYPGQTFEGTIFYVSPRAEFTPRNVQTREDRERLVYAVEVRIPNADMRLRSGMPVEVTIDGSWQ
jgi:HlyD family secretion protein